MGSRTVGIVGAGPAGSMAALEAARLGAQVLLFDSNDRVGRKLLVTGNGRCNISNSQARAKRYTCADRAAVGEALSLFGHAETVARLRELGVLTYLTPDGWCYPVSESAAAVADTLAAAITLAGVEVHLKRQVEDLHPVSDGWQIKVSGGSKTHAVERVVVATGGKAYPALGSTGAFLAVLERLGHTIQPVLPALAPLTADMRPWHKLQGVRLDAMLRLLQGERQLGESFGNLMFTQTGLSGPAPMNLSHLVSTRPGEALVLEINLVHSHLKALEELIARYRHQAMPLAVLLGAVLPAKMPSVLLPLAELSEKITMETVSDADLKRLLNLITHLRLTVTGTRGLREAQLSTGGVPITEVVAASMASRLVPGLHLAGEVLDVIGPCGGYNLQWAFTSGALAGRGAAS
jgi:hypothetical protein